MEWREVAHEFAPDGALRDIYIINTSVREWQQVYDAIRVAYPVVRDGNDELPDDVKVLLKFEESKTITVEPGGLAVNCHFFGEDEIEFDLVPDMIRSQADLDRVCDFLALVGRAAGKDAILTMENSREWAILRYDSKTNAVVAGSVIPHPKS